MFRQIAQLKKYIVGSPADFFTAQESFSQCGEDRIAALIFHAIGIANPTYLDIGANDPIVFNNSFLFYKTGCRGVCVEANPEMFSKLRKTRPRDTCIYAAVAPRGGVNVDFHIFEERASGLNTLSTQWKQEGINRGFKVERTVSVPTVDINAVISAHFTSAPDFLSIDIEGLELDILTGLDFDQFAPQVICVETFRRSDDRFKSKDRSLMRYIEDQGYVSFADTYINTLFVLASTFPSL